MSVLFSFSRFLKKNWAKTYFFVSLLLVAFFFGYAVHKYGIFPHRVLEDAERAFLDWKKNWWAYSVRPYKKFLRLATHEGSGVVVHDPDKAWKGLTLIDGLVGESVGMQLIDMEGNVVNQWKVSFNEIWPVAGHLDKQPGDFHQEIKGAKLYENGDVIFNFYRSGLVKIDRCSKVIWKLPYRSHHSVYEDKDGNLWFPSDKKLDQPYKVSNLVTINHPEYIFKISPEGKLLKEINIVESLIRSNMLANLFSTGKHMRKLKDITNGDNYTHLNDVEILEGSKARAFPMFEEGDILASLRNFNMIVVIDVKTEKIKWSMTGPFIRQHDPDFNDNGHISVFDNRGGKESGGFFGDSRILEINPVTRKITVVYEGSDDSPFFSAAMGSHQRLPNGNILIAESGRGRVFEVNGEGEIVWSYIYRWDEDEVVVTYQATRYPERYGKVHAGKCS